MIRPMCSANFGRAATALRLELDSPLKASNLTKTPDRKNGSNEAIQMPFNDALKRVWAAPPMPKTKAKPAAKTANKKPAK